MEFDLIIRNMLTIAHVDAFETYRQCLVSVNVRLALQFDQHLAVLVLALSESVIRTEAVFPHTRSEVA